MRETTEETGASARFHPWHDLHRHPIDIDIHPIPENPARQEGAHIHFDFRYLLVCAFPQPARAELQTRWSRQSDLDATGLRSLMEKLRVLRVGELY